MRTFNATYYTREGKVHKIFTIGPGRGGLEKSICGIHFSKNFILPGGEVDCEDCLKILRERKTFEEWVEFCNKRCLEL